MYTAGVSDSNYQNISVNTCNIFHRTIRYNRLIENTFKGFCALFSTAIPSSDPSIYPYSVYGYEGETVQFGCSLSTLGSPPVIWSWFCGQEQMTSGITYSTTYTYLTFKLSMKYHLRSCYCRATSPSTLLIYNRSSSQRAIYVNRE